VSEFLETEKGRTRVSQRGVQLVIGKLLTDAAFRHRFDVHGGECLAGMRDRGVDLSAIEVAALVETDSQVWSRMATWMDRRLQRGRSVTSERATRRIFRPLTARQQRVLAGVCDGLSNKEIAAEMSTSETAVKATLQEIFRKARVRRRAQLVRLAMEGALRAVGHPQ
jgi:DNA-binding CsgD family transcriptional regulator